MYKELFKTLIALVSETGRAWERLAGKEEKGEEYLSRFIYPFLGLIAASAFVGVLFTQDSFSLEYALKRSIKAFVSYFGGFYLAAYLLNELWKGFFRQGDNPRLCRRFTGYASAPMFAIYILLAWIPLLPLSGYSPLRILILYMYTGYIVWEGAGVYMKIEERRRTAFTVAAAFLIVSAPELINTILFILMPGMRI